MLMKKQGDTFIHNESDSFSIETWRDEIVYVKSWEWYPLTDHA